MGKKAKQKALVKKAKAPKSAAKSAKPSAKAKGAFKTAKKAVAKATQVARGAVKAAKSVAKKLKSAAKAVKPALKAKAKQAVAAVTPQPAQGSVCHVEFYAPDVEAAKSFWGELLGLTFQPMGPNEYYFHGKSGWGPGGCLMQGDANCTAAPVIYWQVDDIVATLAHATKLGASTVKPKEAIPGNHGCIAHFKTAEGNLFGLWSRS